MNVTKNVPPAGARSAPVFFGVWCLKTLQFPEEIKRFEWLGHARPSPQPAGLWNLSKKSPESIEKNLGLATPKCDRTESIKKTPAGKRAPWSVCLVSYCNSELGPRNQVTRNLKFSN